MKSLPERQQGLLAAILSDESYMPAEPDSVESTGLPISLVEALICKRLSVVGTSSGRKLADDVCLPFRVLEDNYQSLRSRQLLVHRGSAPLNDYNYTLTEQGRNHASAAMKVCSYAGPAPVPLIDYVLSTEAKPSGLNRQNVLNCVRRLSQLALTKTCSKVSDQRSTPGPVCSSMGNPAMENRRWRSESQCALVKRYGSHTQFSKTDKSSNFTTRHFTNRRITAKPVSSSRPHTIDAG